MSNHPSRSAYTLIEILVATAVAMILMLAIMRMFSGIGESLNKSRADMNLALELRRIESLLNADLENRSIQRVTTDTTPSGHGGTNGYFTYQEGPMWTPSENEPRLQFAVSLTQQPRTAADLYDAVNSDGTSAYTYPTSPLSATQQSFFSLNMAANDNIPPDPDSTVGDLDDQLAFTVTNSAVPYRGRGIDPTDGLGIVESPQAEVAWFVRGTTLYRRVLLIDGQARNKSNSFTAPVTDNRTGTNLNQTALTSLWTSGFWPADADIVAYPIAHTFYDIFDVSVRRSGNLVPNGLADLDERQNRFGSDRNPSLPYPPNYERPTIYGDMALPSQLTTMRVDGVTALSTIPVAFTADFWQEEEVIDKMLDIAGGYVNNVLQGSVIDPPPTGVRTPPRYGEDIVLKNVLSFDVKAWIDNDDPAHSGTPLPAYFADLGWRGTAPGTWLPHTDPYNDFSIAGRYGDPANLPTNKAVMPCIYDTWWSETILLPTPHEIQPSYGCLQDTLNGVPTTIAAPLRAIQITIRVYEPQFRTIQEVRVVRRLEP